MAGIKSPELEQLERIQYQDREFPIHCITLGLTQSDAPVLAFLGRPWLEKIGSEVTCFIWKLSVSRWTGISGFYPELKSPG